MNNYSILGSTNKKPAASRSRTIQDKKFEISVEAKKKSHVVRDSADAVLNSSNSDTVIPLAPNLRRLLCVLLNTPSSKSIK